VIRSAWWVSLREKDTQRWWHGKSNLSNEQAHALFDFLCGLRGETLQAIMNDLLAVQAETGLVDSDRVGERK
jgi:hypothetical protein